MMKKTQVFGVVAKRTFFRTSCLRNVGTSPGADDDAGSDPMKIQLFGDQEDRRGYKYEGAPELLTLIDKSTSMGSINTVDADGFKARHFRTGAEPLDPEKAKEIMIFFKNRPRPPKIIERTGDFKTLLRKSNNALMGRARDFATSLRQRAMGGQTELGGEEQSKDISDAVKPPLTPSNAKRMASFMKPGNPKASSMAPLPRVNYNMPKPPKKE